MPHMEPETDIKRRSRQESLVLQLNNDYDTNWKSLHVEIAEYISPDRALFNEENSNSGKRNRQKILNNCASQANVTLTSGMQSGITSPARPWMSLSVADPMANQDREARVWLTHVEAAMKNVFAKSNLYKATPEFYSDLGAFGIAAMQVNADDKDTIRCYTFPVGSYRVANNDRGIVETWVRQYERTVSQVVEEYGYENCSDSVQSNYKSGQVNVMVKLTHVIELNRNYNPKKKLDPTKKKFASVTWETSKDQKRTLRDSGFNEFPILVARWSKKGDAAYGFGPGRWALDDTKGLQKMEKDRAMGVEQSVNPSMLADPRLRRAKVSNLPGKITFIEMMSQTPGMKRVFDVNIDLDHILQDIERQERRIKETFSADLFRRLLDSTRREMTATEVQALQQEKLVALGPVLENVNDEFLDPFIDRVFSIMLDKQMIPPPPPIISEMDLKVEYISILAVAQKSIGLAAVDRLVNYVAGVAGAKQDPSVWDKIDTDQTIDMYGDMLAVPPSLIVSDEDVAAIREERQAQIKAQQEADMASQQAQTVQALSNSSMEGDTALTQLAEQVGI